MGRSVSPPALSSGLVSITFRGLTPREIVALVGRAGLCSIEWGGDVHVPHGDEARARDVGEMTRDAGLQVAAYGSYYRLGHSEATGLPFARVLASALALGAPLIRVWAGNGGPAQTDDATRAAIVADAQRVATLAAAAGVVVASEFHGGTLTETAASAHAFLCAVGHPNFRSLWQPPNGQDDATCSAALATMLPYLANLHVFHWGPGGFHDRRPLAEGAARWRPWLAQVAAGGTARHALLEFVAGDAPDALLADAQTLRGWLAEIAAQPSPGPEAELTR